MPSFGFYETVQHHQPTPSAKPQQSVETSGRLKDLEHDVQRLRLLNQALWELVCEKTGLSDADLEAKAQQVDLRDGIADGRMTETAVRCPTCSRVSNSKHYKCLYCGQQFEKPVMG